MSGLLYFYQNVKGVVIINCQITMSLQVAVFCLLVVSLKGSVILSLSQSQHGAYFQWKSQYARSYQNGQVETYRLSLWLQNYNRIEAHNARYQSGEVSYSVALNGFADMPKEQISSGFFASYDDAYYSSVCSQRNDPASDYSTFYHQFSQPIFNQATPSLTCGSGWAMAASTTLSILYTNTQRRIKNSTMIYSLSPQQLLDCTVGSYAGNGCSGGSVYKSWLYYTNVGAVLNSSYPYAAAQSTCNSSKTPIFSINSCVSVPSSSEVSLRNAVTVSPVTVQINGDAWGLMYYSGGIYDGSDCNDYDINHSLTIIGYDYEIEFDSNMNPYNVTYWKGVNSFGTSWGEAGTVRLLRTEEDTTSGLCGMYLTASYPII